MKKRAKRSTASPLSPADGGRGTRPAPPEPDLRRAQELVLQMLAVPGRSSQERRVAEFILRQLRRAGAPDDGMEHDDAHRQSPYGGEVGNLVLRLPGTRPGPRRLLMAHMDTVPLCVGAEPEVQGDWVIPADADTALGADDRSGATAILVAALEILRHRLPHPPLTFLWTVQEEVGLYGARHARLSLLQRPRLAFNFDGASPDDVTIGATGGYRMAIHVRGQASHAGVAPERGVSAIAIAGLAIAQLHREGWHGRVEKGKRSGTSNVGVIRGGEATNVVTPEVELRAEARSHDPGFRQQIVAAFEKAFHDAARSVRSVHGTTGEVQIDGHLDYEAFRLPEDASAVLAAQSAVRHGGRPAQVCHQQRRLGRKLDDRAGHSHGDVGGGHGQRPHHGRAARPGPFPPGLPHCPLLGYGDRGKRPGDFPAVEGRRGDSAPEKRSQNCRWSPVRPENRRTFSPRPARGERGRG